MASKSKPKAFDVLIVGGGPAGSTCARQLKRAGINVAVIDGAKFPRVKLCSGWISPPIWDLIELNPDEYPLDIWEWEKMNIHFFGKEYRINSHGYFIRRYEFDNFLLKRSKAKVFDNHLVRNIEKDSRGNWVLDGKFKAKILIGAGGTQCPIARKLFPKKSDAPVTTQEKEFRGIAKDIAKTRMGGDGEAELLLHEDMMGYSWNVPKTSWLNIGSGTLIPRQVHETWSRAREFFESIGHVPQSAKEELNQMRGHPYYLYSAEHIKHCKADSVFLIGDALGLAQPFTGEGILPAVTSGKLCADAIIDGVPEKYPEMLKSHPLIKDYNFLRQVRDSFWALDRVSPVSLNRLIAQFGGITARVFAYMFEGKPLPGRPMVGPLGKGFQSINQVLHLS